MKLDIIQLFITEQGLLFFLLFYKPYTSHVHVVQCSLLNLNDHHTSSAVLLTLRASQLQMAFADCAADIKSTYESQEAKQAAPSWPASVLNCIAILFLRAERAQDAW